MNYLELIEKSIESLKNIDSNEEKNEIYKNIGFYYYQSKNKKLALNWFLKINPKDFSTCRSIAAIYLDINMLSESNQFTEYCLQQKFDLDIAYDLALHYTKVCSYRKALGLYETILDFDQSKPNVYNNIADIYNCMLQPYKAMDCYLKAYELDKTRLDIYSNLVMTSYYIYKYSPVKRFNYAKKFEDILKSNKVLIENKNRRSEGLLRVGYIGFDFDKLEHPISCFVKHIIENHNKNKFKIFCYQASNKTASCFQKTGQELYTNKINNVITKNLSNYNTEDSAKIIYNDKIDILIELMHHTAGNRLSILAFKPAPIQISYCAFPGTTGMSSIDYKILDNVTYTNNVKSCFTEKIIRMNNGFHCYVPTYTIPKILHRVNGPIHFCCFNNIKKINDKTIRVWIHILRLIPGSQLFLRYYQYSDSLIVEIIKKRFEKIANDDYVYKFNLSRIHFIGYENNYTNILKLYQNMDIFLDTFPYTGTTVICEALTMSIPVITLLGKNPHERVSASLLTSMNKPELIAIDEQEYLNKAVTLGKNRNAIIQYKKTLQLDMKKSILGNSKIFMKEYESHLINLF